MPEKQLLQSSLDSTGKMEKPTLLILLAKGICFQLATPQITTFLEGRHQEGSQKGGEIKFQPTIHPVIQAMEVAIPVKLVPNNAKTT